jgi:carbonic anhydrase
VRNCYQGLDDKDRLRVLSLENIVCQLGHLRTHPSVAAGIARGKIALHGWFVDIHAGSILALDEQKGHFTPVRDDAPLPIALPHASRLAAFESLKQSA